MQVHDADTAAVPVRRRRRAPRRSSDGPAAVTRGRRSAPALPATHPAWGVAFLGGGGTVVCEIALLLQLLSGGPVLLLVATGVFIGCAGGSFLWLVHRGVDRWRSWMTHAAVATGEVSLVLLIMRSTDGVTAVTFATLFSWVAALVGLYLSARLVAVHVVVLTVALSGALVTVLGVPTALTATAVLAPVFAGIAVLCARLASLLREQSTRDSLTGLLNRRGLEEASARCAESALRSGHTWSVVAIDLDGFKAVNDRLGHAEGDRLLRTVAAGWRTVLRQEDVLARTGGDEFVVLLPGDADEATATVERLRDRTPAEVGVSAGTAPWSVPSGMDEALRLADAALYRAKRSGRGCTVATAPDDLDPRRGPAVAH